MTTINWGILGASRFAQAQMAPAIHMAANARLFGVASASGQIEDFAPYQPDLKFYRGYEALLDDPAIDAVYIPLPNHLHVEWTKRAIAAGKHVLCEKPIAMQAREIRELIALRDASGKTVTEAYMIVHHPQWQRAPNIAGGSNRPLTACRRPFFLQQCRRQKEHPKSP